jgi:hypothetical protein
MCKSKVINSMTGMQHYDKRYNTECYEEYVTWAILNLGLPVLMYL